MHIPDNYLSPSTSIGFGTAMIFIWKRAVYKVKSELSKKKLPILGVCAAFSFLIMMFNIPVPGGTTAHTVGATLVAILIGPYAAVISVTTALIIQAVFFGDGGIITLGVNTFNMAFAMPFAGYYLFKLIKGKSENTKVNYWAAFLASYLSINLAALLVALELGVQPILFRDAVGPLYCPYGLNATIPAMTIPHLLVVGILEGVVTAGVYGYIKKVSPGLIYEDSPIRIKPIYVLIMIMIAMCPIGLIATGTAWGEWGNDELMKLTGYIPNGMAKGFKFSAVMQDYGAFGLPEKVGYIVSALTGVIILIAIFKVLTNMIKVTAKE